MQRLPMENPFKHLGWREGTSVPSGTQLSHRNLDLDSRRTKSRNRLSGTNCTEVRLFRNRTISRNISKHEFGQKTTENFDCARRCADKDA